MVLGDRTLSVDVALDLDVFGRFVFVFTAALLSDFRDVTLSVFVRFEKAVAERTRSRFFLSDCDAVTTGSFGLCGLIGDCGSDGDRWGTNS